MHGFSKSALIERASSLNSQNISEPVTYKSMTLVTSSVPNRSQKERIPVPVAKVT